MKKKDVKLLWPHIEALATFIPTNNDEWWMTDAPVETLDALEMIGGAVMTALGMLERSNDLGPGSSIPNVALTVNILARRCLRKAAVLVRCCRAKG